MEPLSEPVEPRRPAFGRPSAAADHEPALRSAGDAASASWRADGASRDWCTLRAASVVGVRHRLAGQGPEDSYAWACAGAGALFVAVADGVGSLPGSAAAAARAASAAVTAARGALPAGAAGERVPHGECGAAGELAGALVAGVEAANRAAEGGGATTLVMGALSASGRVILARVGDSSAFVVRADGQAAEAFPHVWRDSVETTTAALPAADPALEVVEVEGGVGPGEVLLLATDGLAEPWRDGPTTVAPALSRVLLGQPGPLELLRAVDFSRQGCHDDRTALCAWLTGGLPGVGESVDAGAVQGPHLDHVAPAGDQAGNEDAEGGQDAPPHPGAHQEDQADVGGEHATVTESDHDQGAVQAPGELVARQGHDPGDAEDHEERGLPEGHFAQQLDHPHRLVNLVTG